jgi:hypothetical protein
MITERFGTSQIETSATQTPVRVNRRSLIGGALAALAIPRVAKAADAPHDPFILLLRGVYVAVPPVIPSPNGPNLGLTTVTLDNSYVRTQIYPVFGFSGDPSVPVGHFYLQLTGSLCAYDLPGGAIAMQFVNGHGAAVQRNFGYATMIPDGKGGFFLKGTFELNIVEATGVYSAFASGHNHMVASTHLLADGSLDEYCFCHISGKGR